MDDYWNFPYKNLDYLVTSFYKKKSHKLQYEIIIVVKTVVFCVFLNASVFENNALELLVGMQWA